MVLSYIIECNCYFNWSTLIFDALIAFKRFRISCETVAFISITTFFSLSCLSMSPLISVISIILGPLSSLSSWHCILRYLNWSSSISYICSLLRVWNVLSFKKSLFFCINWLKLYYSISSLISSPALFCSYLTKILLCIAYSSVISLFNSSSSSGIKFFILSNTYYALSFLKIGSSSLILRNTGVLRFYRTLTTKFL